jgi:hypothetical protein
LLFLLYGNKRKRSKWDTLVIMLLLGVAVTMSLAACGGTSTPPPAPQGTPEPSSNPVPDQPPVTVTPTPEANGGTTATDSGAPLVTLTVTPTPCPTIVMSTPTYTPSPTGTPTFTVEEELLSAYGVKFVDGNLIWSSTNKNIALGALSDIAKRMGSADIFRSEFDTNAGSPIYLIMGTSAPNIVLNENCTKIASGGCTTGKDKINFASLSPWNDGLTARNLIVHEFGHVFNNVHGSVPMTDLANSNINPENFVENRSQILLPNVTFSWQLDTAKTPSETFADFFVAWTYDAWQPSTDTNGRTTIAGKAMEWMNEFMTTH